MTSRTTIKSGSTQTRHNHIIEDPQAQGSDELTFYMTTPSQILRIDQLTAHIDTLQREIKTLRFYYERRISDLTKQIEMLHLRNTQLKKENVCSNKAYTALLQHLQKVTKHPSMSNKHRLEAYVELLKDFPAKKQDAILIQNISTLNRIEAAKDIQLGVISQTEDEVVICDAFETSYETFAIETRIVPLEIFGKSPTALAMLKKLS